MTSTSTQPIIVLVGPTAVGKSRYAVKLAQFLETDVLAADSRQVYRGMDIATDKPTTTEQEGISHRLIDLVDPDERFNAGDYRRHALDAITRLHGEGRIPLIVGGTGLYVRVLLRGLCEAPPADWVLRRDLEAQISRRGPSSLHAELLRLDPEAASQVHPHDTVKIIRALEVYRLTGCSLTALHREHAIAPRPFRALVLGLTMNRDSLYRRIEQRVDRHLARGLVQETQRLLGQGYERSLSAMKGLGYRQIAGFLEGEYSYEEAVRILKRDTRHFAKRQMTWFRREPEIRWVGIGEHDLEDVVVARLLVHVRSFLRDAYERAPECPMKGAMTSTG